jgi:hypothetical protein
MADVVEAQLLKELARSARAKTILEDPMVKESFEMLEKDLIEGLLSTAADDGVKREKIHMMLVYGRKWRNLFASMVETGKLAELQLDEKRKFRLWRA